MSDTLTRPRYHGGPKCGEEVPAEKLESPRHLYPARATWFMHAYVLDGDRYRYLGEIQIVP